MKLFKNRKKKADLNKILEFCELDHVGATTTGLGYRHVGEVERFCLYVPEVNGFFYNPSIQLEPFEPTMEATDVPHSHH